MSMKLNIKGSCANEQRNKLKNLIRERYTNRIGNTQTIDITRLGYGEINTQQIGLTTAKAIFCAKTQDDIGRLFTYKLANIEGNLDNFADALAVTMLHEFGRSSNNNVEAMHARF